VVVWLTLFSGQPWLLVRYSPASFRRTSTLSVRSRMIQSVVDRAKVKCYNESAYDDDSIDEEVVWKS